MKFFAHNIFTTLAVLSLASCSRAPSPTPTPLPSDPPPVVVPPAATIASAISHQPSALTFRPPTGQLVLDGSITTNVFMDTGTSRPESGMFGDTRVGSDGRPRFHGGIDIAPLRRDRRGVALDTVHAIAEGRVVYVSRNPGASNYGIYIVLTHRDPAFGEIYSLYAHLASVASGLAVGQDIPAGHTLGVMGRTPDIPHLRSHLHLETGVIINTRYAAFSESRKTINHHGNWNGLTLLSFNPSDLYARLDSLGRFDLCAYYASIPTAFRVAVRAGKPIDFFKRHPSLWQGGGESFPAWVLVDFSAEGLPLFARFAAPSEIPVASGRVVAVDEEALGRNGRRLVSKQRDGTWRLSQSGEDWVSLLLFN